ncbi:FR47-like protein [compost metagenome]
MLVAVATHPDYRGQGLATRVVAKLCTDLLAEGKSLCLFYNNPQAGLIYKKLGFSDIGSWTMMYMKKQ